MQDLLVRLSDRAKVLPRVEKAAQDNFVVICNAINDAKEPASLCMSGADTLMPPHPTLTLVFEASLSQ